MARSKRIRSITQGPIPCWCEIGWNWKVRTPAIFLRIWRDFLFGLTPAQGLDSQRAAIYARRLKLKAFRANFTKNLGFGGCLKNQGERKGFLEYAVALPRCQEVVGQCPECSGRKKVWTMSEQWEPCDYCGATGQEHQARTKEALAISASFTMLFDFLFRRLPVEPTRALNSQLLTVFTETQPQLPSSGFRMYGDIGQPLARWLFPAIGRSNISEEIVRAMRSAYIFMNYPHRVCLRDFHFWRGDQSILNMGCPGTPVCNLYSGGNPIQPGVGVHFDGHGVDRAYQQLTLLVGLATLHDLARKEGVK